jgi:uncharacterized protein YndB with AHSA1/START domain
MENTFDPMSEVQAEITIAAPPERVFDYAADPENMPRWLTIAEGVDQVERTPDPLDTRWRVRINIFGMSHTVPARISEYDRPRRLAFTMAGPMDNHAGAEGSLGGVNATLNPTENGSHVVCELSYTVPGGAIGRLVELSVHPLVRQGVRESLRRLKVAVERGS